MFLSTTNGAAVIWRLFPFLGVTRRYSPFPRRSFCSGLFTTITPRSRATQSKQRGGGDTVTYPDNTQEPMDLHVLPMPKTAGADALMTQAGVGLCAYKTTAQKAEAAALFTGLMEQVRQSAYSTLYGVTFEMSRLIMRLAEDMGEFFETEWYRMLPAARVGIDHFDSLALLEQTYIRAIDDICAYVCGKRRDHEMAQKHDDLIREVDQIIAQSYEDANLNADVIAERFSMSSAYLRRLYRKETGRSLNDTLMDVRLQKICDLLAGTDRPLNDIAEASGIRNANYLYTVFKKAYGMTPIEYRALNGAKHGD